MASRAFVYVWEYWVSPEKAVEFHKLYGPEGAWVSLFRQGTGYLDTLLLRDRKHPDRYLTIDRWESEDEFVRFREAFAEEFESLDEEGERLTREEAPLGKYQSIDTSD